MSSKSYKMSVLVLMTIVLTMTQCTQSFLTTTPPLHHDSYQSPSSASSLHAKKSSSPPPPSSGQFELQELRAQLQTMKTKSISSRYLAPEKRTELSLYLTSLVSKAPSPISKRSIGPYIKGKTWRLAFSTEQATLDDLPFGATVFLRIKDDDDGGESYKKGELDYVLKFSKRVWGLRELVAKCTYQLDTSAVNPGLLTFIYQNIQTDMFGMKNLPIGFFGLLKDRGTFLETIWFDGQMWVDRGFNDGGMEYYNVYWLEDEEDEWNQ
mmetsp:Transcript_28225/g.37635  ORF Transcript_28225/g.37635 Transcript_28225/m.37635 type:complete len:266 (-) Transcript_28225:158-955(-)